MHSLSNKIIETLTKNPRKLARELAVELNISSRDINQMLYKMDGVVQDEDFRWSLSGKNMNNKNQTDYNLIDDIELTEDEDQKNEISEPNISLNSESENYSENSEKNDTSKKFAFDSLDSIRKRLLDLTGRNSLLNFKHPKTSCIRLIDELPDQIYEVLQQGTKFTFIPVAEPTERELIDTGYIKINPQTNQLITSEYPSAEQWAKHLKLSTSYDLPEVSFNNLELKHQDTNLQTLFYAPELEARLRKIRASAESSIEESGANILYLSLGYLEWYENRESDVSRLSPLFTLPVQLERTDLDKRAGAYRYTIQLKDDNLITNITLKEKLANDFGLILPLIDDETTPESYFEQIKATILKHQPRWKVRRQASLVLLNFAKQAMYEDLDPESWPEHSNIEEHPLIQLFFASQGEAESGDSFTYEPEHALDEINDVHEQYPLIYDADSSQHSAIVDVVNGKSLVIEGPPGSGKSQTITNIIAACIANGQKVLFVAEKMAALNVVKNRLDRADLGDFCLELHSHKTNKQKILSDLNSRLSKQPNYISPQGIEADIERYEDLKSKLNKYVLKINSSWASTGLTIHQILQKATRLREEYSLNPENLKIDGLNGENLTALRQNELADYAHMLGSIYSQVSEQAKDGQIKNHYWYGVEAVGLTSVQIEQLILSLKEWSKSLSNLEYTWSQTLHLLELENNITNSLAEINQYVVTGLSLPSLIGGEQLDKLEIILEKNHAINEWLETYEKLHSKLKIFQTVIVDEALVAKSVPFTIFEILKALKTSAAPNSHTLEMLADDKHNASELLELSNKVEVRFKQIVPNAPLDLKGLFFNSYNSLSEVLILIKQIQKLPSSLWRHRDAIFDNSDLDSLIEVLAHRLKDITPIHSKLKDEVSLDKLPNVETLKNYQSTLDNAGFFKWLSSDWRQTRNSVLSLSKKTKPNKKQFINLLPEVITYAEQIDTLLTINNKNPILGSQFQGVDTPIQQIEELRSWYKSVREEYGIGFGERVKIGNAILSLEREFAMALSDEANKGLLPNIELLLSRLEYFQKNYSNHSINKHRNQLLAGNEGELSKFTLGLTKFLDNLSAIFKDKRLTLTNVESYGNEIQQLQQESDNWYGSELNKLIQPLGDSLQILPNSHSSIHLAVAKNTVQISKIVSQSRHVKNSLLNNPSEFKYQQILKDVVLLQAELVVETNKRETFIKQSSLNFDNWIAAIDDSIVNIVARNESALNHISWLNTWLEYIQLKNRLYAEGFKNFIGVLEASQMKSQDLQDIVNLVINYQLANEIFTKHSDLANFTGLEQTAIQQRFKEYDAKILRLQRQKVAFKASRQKPSIGVASGRVSEYTEVSLIKQEIGKKIRHIAVRSLLKRAGNAIQTLKPCFMMSPMSVAQYLEPGRFKFDLVVMDEASQIRPEDALGAIARGVKLVVVGDPKQLPPTSFFNKVLDEDPEEEIVGLQDSESILESVMPMFINRRLRWHYRSKHESLIAFSNKHFYDSDLVIFPSPFKSSPEFGVKQHYVPRGRFANGRNVEEAQEVVRIAAIHLINNPHESLGIVAMNAAQRDEIEKQLDQLAKDFPELLKAYEINKSSEDPLFIKNLENVQGDERDIIYISMTYGPEQIGGRTMQRFGPINSDVGWRRLNVLFTRSKKRMHIFNSMSSGDILLSGTSSKGVKSLKAFLEYTETGHLHQTISTGKASDSDFELAVIQILEKNGYECEPQLGTAGYFLDIAVRDPGKPGKFLMGIECDGATYHSAKSARDRDYLRQEILESLGWKIRRIWSTDWFKHPQAQIQPILNELEKLRTPILEEQVVIEDAFKDTDFEHVAEIVNSHVESEKVSSNANITIRDRLLAFDRDVIRSEFPKTEGSKRLLREEMLDVLLEHLPTSKAEFQEFVPSYLRTGTITYEAKFLDDVLSIIADYA